MSCWLTTHRGEGAAMPSQGAMPLVEGFEFVGDRGTTRWVYQQTRDEHLFQRRWVAEWREAFKREMRRRAFFTYWQPETNTHEEA